MNLRELLEPLEPYLGKTTTDFLAKIVPPAIMLMVCLIIIKMLMKVVRNGIEKSKLDKGLHKFVEKTVVVILYAIMILIVADMLGIPTNSLLSTFNVIGLAASLAAQDVLSNIASGIVVLVTHPFKTGDYVDVSNVSGTVKEITFTHTVLTTIDNKIIRVPNKDVVNATITDYSENKYRRVCISFGVSYDTETKLVTSVIAGAIDQTPHILKDREIFNRVTAYKDSCIEHTIKVWTKNEHYWDVYYDLLDKVKEAFDNNGIQIPYNQLDVHVHNVT